MKKLTQKQKAHQVKKARGPKKSRHYPALVIKGRASVADEILARIFSGRPL